ncbi:CHRD domain-containing protein [Pseudolabrys taiwanensis]|uniref:CHRD domain-containing protein n=1 Tax=Pseudolabrys taiwanensis TaxID=331696 RepID=A0A345ZT04_9HYPH|nr:CHRD domain-containing protein [Pseudolabrys taiwanensis]AXK80051.1 CHRD domain-containing protein [Pseudolabrys taiwanensis]
MTVSIRRPRVAALAFLAVLSAAAPAAAETINLKADLKAANEVPPNDSPATGSLTAAYDTATKKLTWKGSYSNLTGPAVAAHFHAGEPGKNGGIQVPITGAGSSPFEGSATLTDAQASDLLAGRLYVNVHTAAHTAGEIRGQVQK